MSKIYKELYKEIYKDPYAKPETPAVDPKDLKLTKDQIVKAVTFDGEQGSGVPVIGTIANASITTDIKDSLTNGDDVVITVKPATDYTNSGETTATVKVSGLTKVDIKIGDSDIDKTFSGTSPAGTLTATMKTHGSDVKVVANKITGISAGETIVFTLTPIKPEVNTINGSATSTVDHKVSTTEVKPAVTGYTVTVPASKVGEPNVTPVAKVKPDGATAGTITWTTSDTAIATIDSGKVHAVKAGDVDIIATDENSKTGKKTITVAPKA